MTTNLLSVIEQQQKALEKVADRFFPEFQMEGDRDEEWPEIWAALAAGKQALEQTQGEACKYADMCNEEGECTSGCSDRKNAQPVAYVVFASNGNIRIWGHAPDDVTRIKAEFGSSLIPLYTNPQASEPAPKRPPNCGTGHCSCIECVMEPAPRTAGEIHDSDCSLHNEPAYPAGPCDCSLSKSPKPSRLASTRGAGGEVVSLPIPASAADLKADIVELIQSHKYKGLRSIEVLGVFQFLGAEIISGSNS